MTVYLSFAAFQKEIPKPAEMASCRRGPNFRSGLIARLSVGTVRFKPVLDTYILERPASSVSDTLFQAMDHEANRMQQELKKH
jgi:hypothetical protein